MSRPRRSRRRSVGVRGVRRGCWLRLRPRSVSSRLWSASSAAVSSSSAGGPRSSAAPAPWCGRVGDGGAVGVLRLDVPQRGSRCVGRLGGLGLGIRCDVGVGGVLAAVGVAVGGGVGGGVVVGGGGVVGGRGGGLLGRFGGCRVGGGFLGGCCEVEERPALGDLVAGGRGGAAGGGGSILASGSARSARARSRARLRVRRRCRRRPGCGRCRRRWWSRRRRPASAGVGVVGRPAAWLAVVGGCRVGGGFLGGCCEVEERPALGDLVAGGRGGAAGGGRSSWLRGSGSGSASGSVSALGATSVSAASWLRSVSPSVVESRGGVLVGRCLPPGRLAGSAGRSAAGLLGGFCEVEEGPALGDLGGGGRGRSAAVSLGRLGLGSRLSGATSVSAASWLRSVSPSVVESAAASWSAGWCRRRPPGRASAGLGRGLDVEQRAARTAPPPRAVELLSLDVGVGYVGGHRGVGRVVTEVEERAAALLDLGAEPRPRTRPSVSAAAGSSEASAARSRSREPPVSATRRAGRRLVRGSASASASNSELPPLALASGPASAVSVTVSSVWVASPASGSALVARPQVSVQDAPRPRLQASQLGSRQRPAWRPAWARP